MIHKITLPKFDANITEATVGAWRRKEGDPVRQGDVLVDLITDKANVELTSETDGVLRKIVACEKSQVPLGYVVALVGEPDDELPDVSAENRRRMEEYLASVTGKTVSAPPAAEGTEKGTGALKAGLQSRFPVPFSPARVRATPRARRLAREHGIDLVRVQKNTGVDVVTEKEVQAQIQDLSAEGSAKEENPS
jgi:pyruvate/2-oxoglutarate dehydrogenase complex dihydrolipoamide acyltransferase (E2) component